MLDFHTHILPKMDDGSRSVEESIKMLREEARQGITDVILTPHFYALQNSPSGFLERRTTSYELLKEHLESGLPKLHLGAEVQYFEGICQIEDLHKLRIQGTKLLLLEMPFSKWSDRVIQDVLEINSDADFQIVLAHVERYLQWQPKDMTHFMLDNGILFQCNGSFFTNWKTRHKAVSMLRQGQIRFIGSDCHNMERRPPNLQEALNDMGKYAEAFFQKKSEI